MSKLSNDSPSSTSNTSEELKPLAYPSDTESKPLVSPSKKPKSSKKEIPQKRVRNAWTAEEEAIYLELMFQHLQDTFWEKVKVDGRLIGRGSAGIKAHLVSVMNKLKKAT